jgi:fatty-acyl-CoA synthase
MLEHTLGTLVEHSCAAYGRETAVLAGGRRITYAEQLATIRRAGRALLDLGLAKGDRVAILMSDRPELLDVYYGIVWAGLTVVPLNARLGKEDHRYILEDSGAKVVCFDDKMAARVADVAVGTGPEHLVSVDASSPVGDRPLLLSDLQARQPDGPGQPPVSVDDRVGLFYTGGTTGRPKGVEHTHRSFVAALTSELLEMGLGERDRFAHVAPLTHAGGLFVLPVWMRGGTNVILGGFDPERLLDTIEAERITATMMVPTMIYVLLDSIGAGNDCSSLDTIIYGASPIGQERLVAGLERFGPVFSQLYGQTEAPNQLNVLHKSDHADAVASGDLTPLASCGRPVAIAEVRVVDDDRQEVPTGSPGEIVARGPHLMKGYWNRPEETEEALRGGWLHTGDIAQMDERRFVSIVDRKKDMIISGGFNVYPKEVESTLFSHPAVRDVCVIGVPDDRWGESVKAVVVTAPGAEVGEAELIAWVKDRKGSVLAPKTVEFREEIPLTAVGKHDKPALRSAFWGGRTRGVN